MLRAIPDCANLELFLARACVSEARLLRSVGQSDGHVDRQARRVLPSRRALIAHRLEAERVMRERPPALGRSSALIGGEPGV